MEKILRISIIFLILIFMLCINLYAKYCFTYKFSAYNITFLPMETEEEKKEIVNTPEILNDNTQENRDNSVKTNKKLPSVVQIIR